MRKIWSDGQEITFEDLTEACQAIEKTLYEKTLHHLVGKSVGMFQDSFFVDFTDATHVSVRAGFGIQTDNTQTGKESKKRPIYLSAASAQTLSTPHASNNRIDLICIKSTEQVIDSVSRQVKDFITGAVAPQTLDVTKDWDADIVVVAGTPAGSPVAPAVPSGYIKLCEILVTASTGVANQAAITDSRILMPILDITAIDTSDFVAVPTQAIDVPLKDTLAELDQLAVSSYALTKVYDAIVGTGLGATHSTIAAAISAVSAGARILVTASEVINTTVAVNKANLEICLCPGVVISKGSATKAFTVTAQGFDLHGGKISGFSAGGNKAVEFASGSEYGKVWGIRFASNTVNVDDSTIDVAQFGIIEE